MIRGRWCVAFICLCLPQLRERSDQRSDDFDIACLGASLRSIFNVSYIGHLVSYGMPSLHTTSSVSVTLQLERRRRSCHVACWTLSCRASHAGGTRIEREHGAPPPGPGPETLNQILQASGHTLLFGEMIFEVLGSIWWPVLFDPASQAALSSPRRGHRVQCLKAASKSLDFFHSCSVTHFTICFHAE
jgi:hypothetical protein